MGRQESAGLNVEDAKRRLIEDAPTGADIKRDALGSVVDFVRARPWTSVGVAVGLGALAVSSRTARRAAFAAALFAARRLL